MGEDVATHEVPAGFGEAAVGHAFGHGGDEIVEEGRGFVEGFAFGLKLFEDRHAVDVGDVVVRIRSAQAPVAGEVGDGRDFVALGARGLVVAGGGDVEPAAEVSGHLVAKRRGHARHGKAGIGRKVVIIDVVQLEFALEQREAGGDIAALADGDARQFAGVERRVALADGDAERLGVIVADGEHVVEAEHAAVVGAVDFVADELLGRGVERFDVIDFPLLLCAHHAARGLHVKFVLAVANHREEVILEVGAGSADAPRRRVETAVDELTGGGDGVGQIGIVGGDAGDGAEVGGAGRIEAVAQIVAASEAVIREDGAVGDERGLRDRGIDGADPVGIRGVEILGVFGLLLARGVLVLLHIRDELLLHPTEVQVVDGGEADIAHRVAVVGMGAEILGIELVEIRIGQAAREERAAVAGDIAGAGAPALEVLLIEVPAELEVEIFADVLVDLEGDGSGRVVVGGVGAVGLSAFGNEVGIDNHDTRAGADHAALGAVTGAEGGVVEIADGAERGGVGAGEGIDHHALREDGGSAVVLGHHGDERLLRWAVGNGAVDTAEIAADVVDPRIVVAIHRRETDREFVADQAAVEVDLRAEEVVAAGHDFGAGEVAAEEASLSDLVVGAADVGFAVEERVGAAQLFDLFGRERVHRGIPDPAVAEGVGVGDATEDDAALHEGVGVGVGFAGHHPRGHLFHRGETEVLDELRVHDRNRVGHVLQLLRGAHAGGGLHRLVAEVFVFGDGEDGECDRFAFGGGLWGWGGKRRGCRGARCGLANDERGEERADEERADGQREAVRRAELRRGHGR